ncbi:hypothetical protein BHF71_08810 [Vulcanibacillus modesticaldus]|uniref:GGDEF domain-containing protein n=2 Tax=Vulcanibacillus modesticaldus TaxID=337097 RepID=A0A1D2YUY4_9BACI|nr:hypothetical protein BHF71_08810 [Vulcanibacillus modesticaldus]
MNQLPFSRLMKKAALFAYVLISISTLIIVSIKMWRPLPSDEYAMILIYLFLFVFVNSFPLKFGDIYISTIFPISLAVFLQYGIVVEAWLTQFAVLVSMLVLDVRRNFTKIVLNQIMLIWMSLLAGLSFFLVGGSIDFTLLDLDVQLLPIIVYTLVSFLVNNIIIYLMRSEKKNFISKDALWDASTLFFTLPFGIVLYLVDVFYGILGVIIIMIQHLIFNFLFKLYSELHHSHQQLKSLNKISASFTSELDLEKTLSALQQAIRELLTFDYSYIYLLKGDRLHLVSIENNQGKVINDESTLNFSLSINEGLTGKSALYKKAQLIQSDADIYRISYNEPYFIKNNKSLLAVPMIWHNQVVGVITLGSSVEYNFSKKDVTIAKILASQAAIAIQNANTYQISQEKNLIDELTGVYNYRAFNNLLDEIILDAEMKGEKVSLIMLDLDHFKQVNDSYGHAAGNEVLKEIAKLLKKLTRKKDVVARYGGEEFTIIIPNTDIKGAEIIAERIRSSIEEHQIVVIDSIEGKGEIVLKVTSSIGVATYPDLASSAKDLIRNADRAMYVGSKQAGRNKVAIYEKN